MSKGIGPADWATNLPFAQQYLATRTVEDGDCLVWTGAVNNGNAPRASINGDRTVNVRRWVFGLWQRPLCRGERVVSVCGNSRCLRHMQAMTIPQANRWMASTGRLSTPAVVASRRRNARKAAIYTMELARECRALRAQGWTLVAISQHTGVSLAITSRICRGEAWPEDISGASVFNWRPAP